MKSIIIFGAGIAGLSAAHELIDLGYDISVYEALNQPGGFFRSARSLENNMPTEYSWHGMGPWYHNTFDLMRKIPFDDNQTLYDAVLSHPIGFGIFPDDANAQFYDEGLKSIPKMFRMGKWESAKWSYLMLKTWTSHRRSEEKFSKLNAAQMWRPLLKDTAYRTWRSCFGPWIGSDWKKASLHTTGDFFKKQLTTKPEHQHKADHSGPAWTHSAGDGWLLLKGPSSEYWFNPWVNHLSQKGVRFFWEKPLTRLNFDGTKIVSAFAGEEKVVGDAYIIAINPFIMAEVLSRTPDLEKLEVLNLFKPLTIDGPHTQVSFRLAFPEKINFPRQRVGVVVCDSEYNLTLFAQEQVWEKGVDLGNDIQSLWTGTSCCSCVPGRIYHKPVEKCTKEEFVEEIKVQIFNCGALDEMIRDANNGKSLKEYSNVQIEIWHEWEFSSNGIKHFQPKWVTTQNTQAYMPSQKTPVSNLFLAGSHTATKANVWSIEGAVESGRRAANLIDQRIEVIDQHRPGWLHLFARIDDILYKYKGPQFVDFAIMLSALLIFLILFAKLV